MNQKLETNATETARGKCCGLRNGTLAATLGALVLTTGMVRAQVTNIIYQDNFARVGALNGSAPDTVNVPGATWRATSNALINAVLMTDGSQISLTNSPNPTNGLFLHGFLPFTPKVGHIYTLSCKVKAISGAANFLELGFATHPLTDSNFNAYRIAAGWVAERGDGGQFKGARGPGVTTVGTATTAFGSTTNTLAIVLDTTTGNESFGWTVRFYTNGVATSIGQASYGLGNLPIKYVAIGSDGATGYFQQFTLTDALNRQGAPAVWEQPPSITAQVGQTATFWVGVTNDYPEAAYQWMTNGPSGPTNAVPGATNAIYTTPALDSSYNGLNYSVAITNTFGATNSAPATLTVVSGPPTVYSATKTANLTKIVVNFSKPVDPVTGLNAANYSLNLNPAPSGISILSASSGAGPNSVILTTSSSLDTNVGYYVAVQHVQDLYGNAMTSNNAPVLPASMVLFLRADSGVVYDGSGSLVVQWIDQTTNGNNAVQYFGLPTYNGFTGPSVRPTTNSLNGHLALSFANTTPTCGKFLLAPSTASLESMISNTTMYAIAQFTAVTANDILNKNWGNLPAPFDWTQAAALAVQYGNGGNNAPASGLANSLAINTPYVMTTSQTLPVGVGTTNNNFYLNGVNNGNGVLRSVVQGMQDGGSPLWIGARADLVNVNMKGQIAEIMLFNTALSDADRAVVDNYLGLKYYQFAITTDLPPSTTSSNGFSVSYTFAAGQGSARGFSYQWQENGTNIPGATGSTYTTPILAPGDNGDTFDVQVTLPGGSFVYSTTNTLTVLNVPPYITSAGIPIWNTNQIIVLFDIAVDPTTATTLANYSLNNGASVLSVAMGDAPNKVVLNTSPLTWSANPGFYTLSVSNVMDLYGNTMTAATPAVALYPANTVVWIRSDTGVTTDSGTNTVNLWTDMSGNNNNFIGGGGPTIQPVLVTNAWGDLVVRFNQTDLVTNYLFANHSSSLAIVGDMSVVAVINARTLANGRSGHIVAKTGPPPRGNIPAPYDYNVGAAGATLLRGNGNGTAGGINFGSFVATNAPSIGYPNTVAVSETGNTVTHYLNGRLAGTGLLSFPESNAFDNGNPAYIGARSDGFNRLAGDLAELIVSASPISANDVASLDSYLSSRHRFVLFNPGPTNMVVSVTNNQIGLSWPADHTGWQLQSNSLGLLVPGAWFTVPGSTSTNQMIITPNPTNGNVLYRMFFQQP